MSKTRRLALSLFTALVSLGVAGLAEGNSTTVLEYETVGSTASIAPSASASSVTPDNLTAGPGLVIAGSATFNFNSWDPASTTFEEAIAAGDHWNWGFEVTQPGVTLNLTTMDIRLDRSGSGPDDFEIRMSLNAGPALSVQSHDYADTASGIEFLNIDVSGLGELASGDVVNFTLAAFNSELSGGTFDLETITGQSYGLIVRGKLGPAGAPTVVSNTNDGGAGSLRDAIANTPACGTITFAAGVSGGTITLTNGQLVIDKELTIDASALAGGLTIDANGTVTKHRVLQVDSGATVVIDRITFTGGRTADGLEGGGGDASNGGGIHNRGDLTLTGCTFVGNATGAGGTGFNSGAGGSRGGAGGHGGGIYNHNGASLAVTHCTLVNNSTGSGGRGGPGGGFGGGDGGDGGTGGGIYSGSGASLTFTHCSAAGNTTGNGGEGGNGGTFGSDGSNGSGGRGGGIRDDGNLLLNNSLVSGNLTGTGPFGGASAPGPDLAKLSGTFTGSGVNFIGDTSGSSVPLTGSILSGEAMLAPLANYGGATQTLLPLPGSPAIDPTGGGNSSPFPFDQRGLARVFNGTVDIGAVEYAPILSIVVDTHLDETDGISNGGVSLREAIEITASGGSITFAMGVGGETIELTEGQLVIERDLIIDASTLANGIELDANGSVTNHRVLQVNPGASVALSNLTITGGKTADGSDGFNFSDGGDGTNGGGIHNSGDLTLTGCTLAGNATGSGGAGSGGLGAGRDGGTGGDGGGIFNNSGASLALIHCTIAENSTGNGGRGGSGGAFSSDGDGRDGGSGGGIYSSSGASLTLIHCSAAGNTTGNGGQGGNDGSNGSGGSGGGITDDGNLVLNNSLISGNLTGTGPFGGVSATGPDLVKDSGSFTGSGVNFIGDTSGSSVPLTGSILSGDAMLGPLGDYGGTTATFVPLPGSPVIDPAGGDNTSAFLLDQRGFTRVINGTVDIGAVEFGRALVVDTMIDENDGAETGGVSLREAIAGTDPGGTVTFAESVSGSTITLTNGQLVLGKDLNIDASALAGGITIDANGATTGHRVLQVSPGATVVLSNLTLTGGKTSDGLDANNGSGNNGGSGSDGGGIHNSGDLTLNGCSLVGNATGNGGIGGSGNNGGQGGDGGSGGRGGWGGGVYNHFGASLDLIRCTISGNSTGNGNRGGDGGGSSRDGGDGGDGGHGGGIFSGGRVGQAMTHCTISGNSTGNGGRGGDAGGSFGDGGDGGDGGTGGGVFSSFEAALTLTHGTISSNSTGDGGDRGTRGSNGIQGNRGTGGTGGGMRDLGFLNLNNTIISDNLTGSQPFGSNAPGPDLANDNGTSTGSGINFIGINSGSSVPLTGAILSGDALLAPLGNYGGGTQTMLPLSGSPVIDPAGGDTSSPFATDQRGFARVISGIVDIGAVEFAPALLAVIVDTNVDEDDGVSAGGISLRDAIAAAGAGATITFLPALSGTTITLTNGQLVIDKDLAINASALAGGIIIDANGSVTNHRVLRVDTGNTVTLEKLTIQGGKTPGGPNAAGGGIHNIGNLILTDCTVSGNSTGVGSSGGGWGGGISNGGSATLTLTRCTVSNNTTGAGRVNAESGGLGGGISNEGVLILDQSTVSGNTTGSSPGSGGLGGGIFNVTFASLTLTHCTISNNTTGDGGSGSGGAGGGIYCVGDLILTSTLIAGNATGQNELNVTAGGPDLVKGQGGFTGNGVNFIGDTTGSFVPLTGTILSGDALLAPLGNYGGPTQTMALCAGSPAIDAAGPTALTTDQRGLPRTVGGTADIGAYETGNAAGFAIWAIERISHGLDATFAGDADHDGSPNGTEYALGSAVLISDPSSPSNPAMVIDPSGGIEITFGLNPLAVLDTRWVLKRSTDLVTFTEIYSYDGPTGSAAAPGISVVVGATSVTVTAQNPPGEQAFYKFEAQQR